MCVRGRPAWSNGEGLSAVIARVAHKQQGQESPADYGFVIWISKVGKRHSYPVLIL